MLSIERPELYREVLHYPDGIHCVSVPGEGTPRLILKLPVSYLLPAKINCGFKIYAVPVDVSGQPTVELMSAFFDDADTVQITPRNR